MDDLEVTETKDSGKGKGAKEEALAKLQEAEALCEQAGLSLKELVAEYTDGADSEAEESPEAEMEAPEADEDEDKASRKALIVAALRKKA